MIFSNKIYKIVDGINPTLFQENENILNLYIYNKSTKKYQIQLKDKRNCVFLNQYNYKKIIQLDNKTSCVCNNNFITISNETI